MPSLDFKGKNYVYSHHLSVPFRDLKIDAKKSKPAKGTKPNMDDNLIIQGDNLHALKALLPKYAGKIKCIYIDPPYNTGNEGWCYNDKVNSPVMREWLKENANPVEKDDLERHDKWLCMMWPRLQLLRELLTDDGMIFVSIDENEHHSLKQILNEIFYEENCIADFIWHSTGHSDNQYEVKINHEYIIGYAKNVENCVLGNVVDPNTREESNLWKGFAENSITKNGPKNPPSDITLPVGFPCKVENTQLDKTNVEDTYFTEVKQLGYISRDLTKKYDVAYPIRLDSLDVKNKKLSAQCRVFSGWANAKKLKTFIKNDCTAIEEDNGDKVSFYLSEKGVVYYHRERAEAKNIVSVLTNFKTTEKMRAQLEGIGLKFEYPKPNDLIEYIIKVSGIKGNDIILDSFAGSGTTAHAALSLNKEDGFNRKFILVEMEDYANDMTAERVRRVIDGVPSAKDESLKDGLGGSFTYCELGDEFNIEKMLDGESLPDYSALASYVFYTVTGQSLDKEAKQSANFFIGDTDLYDVYLIYKDDISFLRSNDSALNQDKLDIIAAHNPESKKQKVVFATAKYMSQEALKPHNIVFCQIPYAIHKIAGN